MKKILKRITALSLLALPTLVLVGCGFEEGDPFTKKTIDISNVIFNDDTLEYDSSITDYKIEAKVGNQTLKADSLEGLKGVSYDYYEYTNGIKGDKIGSVSTVGQYLIVLNFIVNEALYEPLEPLTVQMNVYNKVDMTNVVFEDASFTAQTGVARPVNATYNSQPVTAGNAPDGIASVTYTYEGTNGTVYDASTTAPSASGTYNVTASFDVKANYIKPEDKTIQLKIQNTVDMSAAVFNDAVYKADGSLKSIEVSNLPTGVVASYEYNGITATGAIQPGFYEVVANFSSTDPLAAPIASMKSSMYIYGDDNTFDPAVYDHKLVLGTDEIVEGLALGNITINVAKWFLNTSSKSLSTDPTVTFGADKNYLKLDKGNSITVKTTEENKEIVVYIAAASSAITEAKSIKINNEDVLVNSTTSSGDIVAISYTATTSGNYNITIPSDTGYGTYKVYGVFVR
ncbi:MAG: hypothetical protein ACI35W_00105 [Anaeroplasmataceae bacterium]